MQQSSNSWYTARREQLITIPMTNPAARPNPLPKSNGAQQKRSLPADPARGALIKRLMDERDWTEAALAADLDVHVRSLQNWRAGRPMRREMVPRLAGALRITPAELAGAHDVPSPPSAEERIAQAVWSVSDRRAAEPVRGFTEVAARIDDLRGGNPGVTLTSLREDLLRMEDRFDLLLEAVHMLRRRVEHLMPPGTAGSRDEALGGP